MSGILASAIVGTSVGISPHARDLLNGIFQDVAAILTTFEGGPNDPHGPISDARTLEQDVDRLDSATRKANDLASELKDMTSTQPQR